MLGICLKAQTFGSSGRTDWSVKNFGGIAQGNDIWLAIKFRPGHGRLGFSSVKTYGMNFGKEQTMEADGKYE
jgi:hypothetical protein